MANFGPFRNRRLIETIEDLQTDLAAFDTASEYRLGTQISTGASSNVASASIFAITGTVVLAAIYGYVSTVVQSQTTTFKLTFDPTGAGADTDLCATVDLNAAAVGSRLHITGTLASAMVKGVRMGLWQATPLLLEDGVIKGVAGATSTGGIIWTAHYFPVTEGALLTAAF